MQVHVFTAGAVATQRNEGINRHVKKGLSKGSSLEKVIREVNKRVKYQADKSAFQETFALLPFKEMSSLTEKRFPLAFAALVKNCSDYAKGRFCQQASLGISAYKILGTCEGIPEDSPDQELAWGEITLDQCDSFRSSSIKEFVTDNVPDGDFVCYAVQRIEGAYCHTVPQIVVLYCKDDTAGSCNQYRKFFCTCGFSTR
jgi:hypothetical protein